MREVELKYRLNGPAGAEALRARLRELQAAPVAHDEEQNLLYDLADGSIRAGGAVLRVRVLNGGPAGSLTYKGPASFDGPVKSRIEHETDVADTEALQRLLAALGYVVTATYTKRREAWHPPEAAVEVTVDELPFGWYCEIEGEAGAIVALAGRLGFSDQMLEPRGYPSLAREWQQRDGQP